MTTLELSHCGYDATLIDCIRHAIASPLRLSHSAVALAAGFLLPSTLEVAIKVSELFIRLNTTDAHDRWNRISRQLMLLHVSPRSATRHKKSATPARVIREQPRTPSTTCSGRWCCAKSHSELDEPRRRGMRTCLPDSRLPTACSFDAHSKPKSTSAWAVTIADRWLDDNFARLPTDEQLITAGKVGGATLVGASIAVTSGLNSAELQAIARALAALSLQCSLHRHSDS